MRFGWKLGQFVISHGKGFICNITYEKLCEGVFASFVKEHLEKYSEKKSNIFLQDRDPSNRKLWRK